MTRERLIAEVAARVPAADGVRVAVDGVDGVGKTTFAAELAGALRSRGRPVVHVSADGFHRVRAERHRRGARSPEGFWLDSYDYPALISNVLAPLGPGGGRRFRDAVHDVRTDEVLDRPWSVAPAGAVLVLDGLFLHRDELAGYWEFSVFLTAPFAVTAARMAVRDGTDPDPGHPDMARYVGGQRLYFAACRPWERATVVIDNSDVAGPRIVARGQG
ncbi:uridine kinase [Amorphoplanes nipponensis]|uniref:Uridine kinase n=1 Tax=Actinoplanes nipponensis TaxID=135950 RepID=A0A919J9C5_9ACTN|nr:uridine kinase [Actinoplanes nipponensis]GIE46498.1 uridine kinase [Actinoplanes nipponensis]